MRFFSHDDGNASPSSSSRRAVLLGAFACVAGSLLRIAGAAEQPVSSPSEPKVGSLTERGVEPQISVSVPRQLKRGLNLSRWWEAEHDRALDDSDIRLIRELGFDFVRLPLDPTALGSEDGKGEMQADKLAALRHDLEALTKAELSVVLDLHPKDDFQRRLTAAPPEESHRILDNFWRGLSSTVMDFPPELLLLDLLNEPKFETSRWWDVQGKLIESLRPVYPHNSFVATASPDSGWWQLDRLEPYQDKNVIYGFHFYEPMTLTHYQLEWEKDYDPTRAAIPVPYPVDLSDPVAQKIDDPTVRAYLQRGWNGEKLSGLVDKIAAWGKKHKATLACLEFGVYSKNVSEQSRMGWLRDMCEAFEKNGIPWAMWEYKGPFGLLPSNASHGDPPSPSVINALRLNGDGESLLPENGRRGQTSSFLKRLGY